MKLVLWVAVGLLAFCLCAPVVEAQPRLVGSLLPSARSVRLPDTATVYASVINFGDAAATQCRLQLAASEDPDDLTGAIGMSWFPLDAQFQVAGPDRSLADIPPGGTQNYVVEFFARPGSSFVINSEMPQFGFVCENAATYPYAELGRVSVHIAASNAPVADILAIGATPSGDQVMRASGPGRNAVMAVAAINIGAAQTVTVRPSHTIYRDIDREVLTTDAASVLVCETNSLAVCLQSPSETLDVTFATGETKTFAVFVRDLLGSGIPFLPDYNRAIVTFEGLAQHDGFTLRTSASTSAAVTSPAPVDAPIEGIWLYGGFNEVDPSDPRVPCDQGGEIIVVPRPEAWAEWGSIVIVDPHLAQTEHSPHCQRPVIGEWVQWYNQRDFPRSITFRPDVEMRGFHPGYRYVFPDDAAPYGNLNFRTAASGGGLNVPRWRQFVRHVDCEGDCTFEDDRFDWNHTMFGVRNALRNAFDFSELPTSFSDTSSGQHQELTIHADGRFEGIARFERWNFNFFNMCPFSGRIYDTVPGSPVFYVRLTVPQSGECETPGFPPRSPYMQGEYEGALVVTQQREGRVRYAFYIRTRDIRGAYDWSYHTVLTLVDD